MAKTGNTECDIFTCLHQYFAFVAIGGEVVMTPPHPDVSCNAHAATFSVVSECGDVALAPDVKKALLTLAYLTRSIGSGRAVHTDSLPISGDEEAKYIITIKKPTSATKEP